MCSVGANLTPLRARKGETEAQRGEKTELGSLWGPAPFRPRPGLAPLPEPFPARSFRAPRARPLLTASRCQALAAFRTFAGSAAKEARASAAAAFWPRPGRLSIGRPAILVLADWLPHRSAPRISGFLRPLRLLGESLAVGYFHWLAHELVSCP